MRYRVLACDYDGTLASHGQVDEQTLEALERLRRSGRQVVLVTGRQFDDLIRIFPQLHLFERVVAENGALLYRPDTGQERLLGEAPPERLISTLRARGVDPISVGRVIVATREPHRTTVLQVIRELSLEREVVLNKGAVMVLPFGVDKATGLGAALTELNVSPRSTVGVGDAENDGTFLDLCGCSVAVANALPAVKGRADLVTDASHGAGVTELIDRLIASDLGELVPRSERQGTSP